jgi:hypothetical protein
MSQCGIAIKWSPLFFLGMASMVALYFILCLMGVAGSKLFYPNSNLYSGCLNGEETCVHKINCYFDNGVSFYGICFLEGILNTFSLVVILGLGLGIISGILYIIYRIIKAFINLNEMYKDHVLRTENQIETEPMLESV